MSRAATLRAVEHAWTMGTLGIRNVRIGARTVSASTQGLILGILLERIGGYEANIFATLTAEDIGSGYVSERSVRDALRALAALGLVEVGPSSGRGLLVRIVGAASTAAHRASDKPKRMRRSDWLSLSRGIFARDGGVCRYCGSSKRLSIDHVLPRSRGGSHDPDNLVTACSSCNSRKNDRTPEEAGMSLREVPT